MRNTIDIINTAIEAAICGGNEILKIYIDPEADFSIEKKADNSPLTAADKASHRTIEKILEKTEIAVLSEEGKKISYETRKNWDIFWLIDPLDGTKEFIKRNNDFTVNIALIKKNRPILGVIFVPVSKTLYIGGQETGAWKMNEVNKNISFSEIKKTGTKLPSKNNKGKYMVVGSRSHLSVETQIYIDRLKRTHPNLEMVSRGSSLKICMVAEGEANEYPRFGPTMEWDTAAGHAIANAANKKLWHTNFEEELSYNKKSLLNPHFIVK